MTLKSRVLTSKSPPIPHERARAGPRAGLTPWTTVLCLLGMGGFVLGFTFPANFDYWWHLAAGRSIWQTGSLPSRDLFSATASGTAWVEHSWTLEAAMYALLRLAGPAGPAALYASAFAATLLIVALVLRGTGLRAGGAAAGLALLLPIFLPYIGPRPQVFGFLLFALLVAVVERAARLPGKTVWVVPALFLVWANVHGSFAIGLGWLALLLVSEAVAARWWGRAEPRFSGEARRRLALALAASLPAIALNPAGPRLLLYPFTKFGNPWLQSLMEWKPTEVNDPRFWPFLLLLGGVVGLLAVRRPRARLSDLVLIGALAVASLYGRRFIPFAAIWLMVAGGRLLAEWSTGGGLSDRLLRRRSVIPSRSAAWLGLVLLLALLALATARPPDPGARGRLPVAAIDQLGATGLSGPLFNDYNWGGYLIWRLYPRVPVFIDGRGDDLYMQSGVFADYMRAVDLEVDPESVLDRYGIRQVLYRPDTAFARYLRATGRWQATYEDSSTVLFERRPAAGKDDR